MDDGTRITVEVEAFLRLARAGDAEKCDQLLTSNNKLVNQKEAGGFGAMHFAAAHGHKSLIDVLLKHKADVNLFNYDQNTPLILGAKCNQPDAVTMLLDAGADINLANPNGNTALHQACFMGNLKMAQLLFARGAKVDSPTDAEKGSQLGTPLHMAAAGNFVEVMFWLLYTVKINIDAVDANGGTALFLAAHSKASDAVQFLLEHGANANMKSTRDNSTPLHMAATAGTIEDIKLLMDYGADPLAADKDGDTPLKMAEEAKSKPKVTELSKAPMDAEKRKAEALRFKEHGNKVFLNGENNKASKFYSRAISLDPTNNVYFSNRSAAYFNTMQYAAARNDAKRCVDLKPDWAKGYFRLASALKALKNLEEASEVVKAGLKIDGKNADLLNVKKDLEKVMPR